MIFSNEDTNAIEELDSKRNELIKDGLYLYEISKEEGYIEEIILPRAHDIDELIRMKSFEILQFILLTYYC